MTRDSIDALSSTVRIILKYRLIGCLWSNYTYFISRTLCSKTLAMDDSLDSIMGLEYQEVTRALRHAIHKHALMMLRK